MANEKLNDFVNESVKDELMSKAERLIDKGIKLEADGKSEKMVSMCIDKAVGFENEALAIK